VAESFEIAAASLTIEAGRKLTITEDSLLEGLLTIKGSGGSIGALVIDGTVAILSFGANGFGHITLEGGKITGTGSDHLTVTDDLFSQDLDITGYGEISVPLTSNVPVISGSGAWRAWGGGGIILNEATCVTGDVEVSVSSCSSQAFCP
jgi:hypothetical protein